MVGPPPAEVPLPDAPLIRVLAQVRFPDRLKIDQDHAFIAEFQEAIHVRYPFLAREEGQQVVIESAQSPQIRFEMHSVWRFADAVQEWDWRVTLGRDFLSLETKAYRSRDDFIGRLSMLLEAAERTLQPGIATRIGLRYIDRMTGPALERIDKLLDPSILGMALTPLRERVGLSLGETLLAAPEEEAALRLRFGLLPANGTIDPTTIALLGEDSWILDLDMFDGAQRPFETAVIEARVRAFAGRIYSVFRELVTPDFLRHYGGRL